MWVGSSASGGWSGWTSVWTAIKAEAKVSPALKVPVPRVRRSFDEIAQGLPASYAQSACANDPQWGVISAYSWHPRKPGTDLVGYGPIVQEGLEWVASGGADTAITAWFQSIPPGQLVDFGIVHEWDSKVTKGQCTKAQIVNAYAAVSALVARLRAAKNTDGTWKYPIVREQVRLVACVTAYGASHGKVDGTDSMIKGLDAHMVDAYGKGGAQSQSPETPSTRFYNDFVKDFLPGGSKDSGSLLRGWGVWEYSCRTDNTFTNTWGGPVPPANDNHRPEWIRRFLDNLQSLGADYGSGFHSTQNGSEAVYSTAEDKRQLAIWMAENADMSPLPTSWPVRSDPGGGSDSPPTAPTHFRLSSLDGSRLTLSWTASTDDNLVAGYRLARNGVTVANIVPGTMTHYTEPAALPDGDYVYLLRAVDDADQFSPFSPRVDVRIGTTPPRPRRGEFRRRFHWTGA